MSNLTEELEVPDGAMEIDGVSKTEETGLESHDLDNESRKIMDQLKQVSPHLPISKLKKIARSDPEYIITSSSAFVASAFATELFVQSLTEEMLALSHLASKNTNSKSLRLSYDNISECVSRKENFQFLEDVVPKTKNLRSLVKENKVRYSTATEGQSKLRFNRQRSMDIYGGAGVKGDIDGNEYQVDEVIEGENIEVDDEDEDLEDDEDDDEDEEDDDEDGEDDEDDEDDAEDEDDEDEQMKEQIKEIEELNKVEDIDDGHDKGHLEDTPSENDDE